jgi:hypothetical protein
MLIRLVLFGAEATSDPFRDVAMAFDMSPSRTVGTLCVRSFFLKSLDFLPEVWCAPTFSAQTLNCPTTPRSLSGIALFSAKYSKRSRKEVEKKLKRIDGFQYSADILCSSRFAESMVVTVMRGKCGVLDRLKLMCNGAADDYRYKLYADTH